MKEKTHLTFLDLLKDARDSHLVAKAQFMLLLMLIVRCDPEKDYSCYPGYELLAEDTGLSMKTLKAAAVGLEGKKLVKRRVRPNHSNVWHINAKLLHETAEAKRAAKAEERSEQYDCPFEPPVLKVTSAAAPVLANKDADKEDGSPAEMDPFFARAVSRIRELFPDHPTLQKAGADRFIAQDVEKMLSDTNHTPEAVLKFLSDLSDKVKATVAASSHLGAYLKRCFSDWLEKQPRDTRIVVSVDGLLNLLNDTVLDQSPDCPELLGDTELWEELQTLGQRHGGVQHVSDVLCRDYTNKAFAGVETLEQVAELLRTQFWRWEERVNESASAAGDDDRYDDGGYDEPAEAA